MDRASLIFCIGALVLSLMVAVVAYPLATVPADQLARAATPQPAEALGSVDVGNGFGSVPVTKLMDHYIANPPAEPVSTPAAAPKIRFGGC
jgi:hypothetical protein